MYSLAGSTWSPERLTLSRPCTLVHSRTPVVSQLATAVILILRIRWILGLGGRILGLRPRSGPRPISIPPPAGPFFLPIAYTYSRTPVSGSVLRHLTWISSGSENQWTSPPV